MQMKEHFTVSYMPRVLTPLCYPFVSYDSFHNAVAMYNSHTLPHKEKLRCWLVRDIKKVRLISLTGRGGPYLCFL
jgi:hypothetical protein